MKSFITWLYRKFVFMPELRAMDIREKVHFLMYKNQLHLVDDIELLRSVAQYLDMIENGPDLKAVQ